MARSLRITVQKQLEAMTERRLGGESQGRPKKKSGILVEIILRPRFPASECVCIFPDRLSLNARIEEAKMLLISDAEVRQVLSMRDCIEVMERAFAEESKGIAVNAPRTRYKVQADLDQPGYMATIIPGAVPSCEVASLRYASTIVQERLVAGVKRMDFLSPSKRNWDFVMLFSLQTGEPLALIHDYSLSAIRVGATTGVAHRALAKRNSKIVGIFGSGHQARANLQAITAVRDIESVKVYSSTKENRVRFAEEMTQLLNVKVQPVSSPEAVVKGSEIVMCATNSSQPVFDGKWLEPGQLVTTLVNTDGVHRRTEADATTMLRSDFIVLNSKEAAKANQQRELLDLIDGGSLGWDKVCELGQVITGEHPGRTSDEQIIYYKSNTGVGIQFAAAGASIYEACKKQGFGRELPTEWFGADLSK